MKKLVNIIACLQNGKAAAETRVTGFVKGEPLLGNVDQLLEAQARVTVAISYLGMIEQCLMGRPTMSEAEIVKAAQTRAENELWATRHDGDAPAIMAWRATMAMLIEMLDEPEP